MKRFFRNSFFIKIARTLISAALLAWLFSRIDWNLFLKSIASANFALLILIGATFFLGVLFSALRWSAILKYLGLAFSQAQIFSLYLIGSFFNNFLPSTIGGDGYKYLFLSKIHSLHKKELAASILFERASGFMALFILNAALLPFFYVLMRQEKALFFLEGSILAVFFFIILVIIFRKRLLELILRKEYSFFLYKKIRNFLVVLSQLDNLGISLSALSYSIFFVLNAALGQWLYLIAFGAKLNFAYVLLCVTIINIAGALPISLNAIGISEGLSVLLYGLAGVSPVISLAVALVSRVTVLIMSVSGGILYAMDRDRS